MSNEKNDQSMLYVYQTAELAKEENRKRIEPMTNTCTISADEFERFLKEHENDPVREDRRIDITPIESDTGITDEPLDSGDMIQVDVSNMKPYGQMSLHHPWFFGLIEGFKYVADMFDARKKMRIVIDYDPQKGYTLTTVYRSTDEQSRGEG